MSLKKDEVIKEVKHLLKIGNYLMVYEAIAHNKIPHADAEAITKKPGFIEFEKSNQSSHATYQSWYSKASQVVKQLLPDRLAEFKKLYILEKRPNTALTVLTFTISDYFLGISVTRSYDNSLVVDPFNAFYANITLQINIVNSCIDLIDSKLRDIEGVLQSELFDTELEMAEDILKKNQIRLAGALAGITLETHLKKVCKNHQLTFKKQHPTINDFNEELRQHNLIDVPTWRLIQRLGDIRNLSVHSKEREPTKDEVEDLIRGAKKLIAELY